MFTGIFYNVYRGMIMFTTDLDSNCNAFDDYLSLGTPEYEF